MSPVRVPIVLREVVLSLAVALTMLPVGGPAFATPGSGVTPSYKVVSSNANIFVNAFGQQNGMEGLLLVFGNDKAPINILNVHQIFAPGGYSGWHTHSGPGIVIVEQGTITIEQTEGCFVDYPQGSVLFEGGPGHIHNASNRTGTPVILDAYFFLPAFDPPGGNSRIDEPVQTGTCDTTQAAGKSATPASKLAAKSVPAENGSRSESWALKRKGDYKRGKGGQR